MARAMQRSTNFTLTLAAAFLRLLALVQIWVIGLDVVFETITYATYLTACIGLFFIVLAVSKNHRLHIAGASVVGLAFLSRMFLQAM